jgi:hypothetical protein
VGGALGAAGVACLLFLVPVSPAATPAPDPPPVAVTPDAQPTAPVRRAPAVTRTVVTPPTAPVVTRTVVTPVIVTREVPVRPAPVQQRQAKPKPKAAVKPKPAVRAKAKPEQSVARTLPPHDRHRVPLARFVPTVEELNRGLVMFAGLALALVALGGGVVLGVGRNALKGTPA